MGREEGEKPVGESIAELDPARQVDKSGGVQAMLQLPGNVTLTEAARSTLNQRITEFGNLVVVQASMQCHRRTVKAGAKVDGEDVAAGLARALMLYEPPRTRGEKIALFAYELSKVLAGAGVGLLLSCPARLAVSAGLLLAAFVFMWVSAPHR